MKNKLLLSTLSLVLNFSTLSFSSQELTEEIEKSKNIGNLIYARPSEIAKAIQDTFNRLSSSRTAYWHENGKLQCYFMNQSTANIAMYLVDNNPDQNIFNTIDLGSGTFDVVDYTVDYLIKNGKFDGDDKSVQINIFGTRAESIEVDKCEADFRHTSSLNYNLFRVGNFMVEDLENSLKGINQNHLLNQFDVISSRFCFMHLVDPLGTLINAYKQLRPGGFMMFDGFPVPFELDKEINKTIFATDTYTAVQRITTFLIDMNIPFLVNYNKYYHTGNANFAGFLVQKPLEGYEVKSLLWDYVGLTNFKFDWIPDSFDYKKAIYRRTADIKEISLPGSDSVMGDEKLYNIYKHLESLTSIGKRFPSDYIAINPI